MSIRQSRERLVYLASQPAHCDGDLFNALRDYLRDCENITREFARAVKTADHLFSMIDRETWRETGADDGQGHYEGDYHAEQVETEIRKWKELLS